MIYDEWELVLENSINDLDYGTEVESIHDDICSN